MIRLTVNGRSVETGDGATLLEAAMAAGERCRFTLEADMRREGGQSKMVIRKLSREVP